MERYRTPDELPLQAKTRASDGNSAARIRICDRTDEFYAGVAFFRATAAAFRLKPEATLTQKRELVPRVRGSGVRGFEETHELFEPRAATRVPPVLIAGRLRKLPYRV